MKKSKSSDKAQALALLLRNNLKRRKAAKPKASSKIQPVPNDQLQK